MSGWANHIEPIKGTRREKLACRCAGVNTQVPTSLGPESVGVRECRRDEAWRQGTGRWTAANNQREVPEHAGSVPVIAVRFRGSGAQGRGGNGRLGLAVQPETAVGIVAAMAPEAVEGSVAVAGASATREKRERTTVLEVDSGRWGPCASAPR